MGMAHNKEEEIRAHEETPRHQDCQEHRDILVLGLSHSVVRLDDYVPWKWNLPLLTDTPHICDRAA
jgi:hypothetical protein